MNLITKHKIAKAHADDMRDEIDKEIDPDAYEVEDEDDDDEYNYLLRLSEGEIE